MSRVLMTVALACSALALAACQPSTESSTTTTTTTTTETEGTPPAATAPGATTATTTTAAAGALPAQCEAYMTRVQQCVDRLGANSPASGMVRQQLDATRQQWSQISDQAALSQACTMADQQWTQTSSAMGC